MRPYASLRVPPVRAGEDEMWDIGARFRDRFPSLASGEYFPRRFNVVSSQVPSPEGRETVSERERESTAHSLVLQVSRTSASASAFSSAFFPAKCSSPDWYEESLLQQVSVNESDTDSSWSSAVASSSAMPGNA